VEEGLATNITSQLIGLSVLSGTNSFQIFSATQPLTESAAARAAHALFTTPATTAPWQADPSSIPESVQVSSIGAMKTIIDMPNNDEAAGSDDVETSFITYKALDRLRMLADTASQPGTTDSQRATLQKAFAKGLSDLQAFLSKAPGNLLSIAFGDPSTSVKGSPVAPSQDIGKATGAGVLDDHNQPVPGLSGQEVFSIDLSQGSRHNIVTVDLSQSATQPPTLDSVAAAFNQAIASIPATDANGNPVLDANGNPKPSYKVTFAVTKSSGKYGLTMNSDGTKVSLQQQDAADSLVVVDSRTQFDTPTGAHVYRYANPADGLTPETIGTVSATDRAATESAQQAAADAADDNGTDPDKAPDLSVAAPLTARASVTDADGFTYIVGTTSGDLGTHRSDGGDDLFLSKLDSAGTVVWQQTLGVAGAAQGAAISLAPDGSIVVAGSVTGPFDGNLGGNSDMLVARFDPSGEQRFATSIASTGDDFATAVAVGADGSIYLAGKSAGAGGGGAYIAHMDGNGKMLQQREIDTPGTDSVNALAIDSAGNLLALTRENGATQLRSIAGSDLTSDLGSVALGSADARAIAVSASGDIAVVGATATALPGDQVNAVTAGGSTRDGFVTRISGDLASVSTTYIGAQQTKQQDTDGDGVPDTTTTQPADDQLDSVTFLGGDIYVGGRTNGNLGAPRKGTVDGFVARVGADGTVSGVSQFGGGLMVADPVQVSVARGGSNVLDALGLHQGALNGEVSTTLAAQTGLRPGDSFSLQVDGGAVKKITIDKGETLTSLVLKIHLAAGPSITATTPKNDDGQNQLEFLVSQGHTLGLIAGPDGQNALSKLGLEPTRLHSDTPRGRKDPAVTPGGSYGLSLSTTLDLSSASDAKAALAKITSAISLTQTAYRSLYWDNTKASQANGTVGPGSAYQQSQLASYQAALQRLTAGSSNGLAML
jgi:hypothetical protein